MAEIHVNKEYKKMDVFPGVWNLSDISDSFMNPSMEKWNVWTYFFL